MSEVDQGASYMVAQSREGARHPMVWPLPDPLWLSFGLRLVSGKIGGPGFVSSNSDNISCVTFLKHKNSRKLGTGTVASH
jgi:hypothetical protein